MGQWWSYAPKSPDSSTNIDNSFIGKIKGEAQPRRVGGSPISSPHTIHDPLMDPIGVPFVTVYSKDFSLDGFILIQVCQKHNTTQGG